MIRVAALARYPVKGLSPEPLARVTVRAGDYFPCDRLFAIEDGPSGFDPAAPVHLQKIRFLMLMRHESLARLKTHYDDESGVLTIRDAGGALLAQGDVGTVEGQRAITDYLTAYMGEKARGALRFLTAPPDFRFTDSRSGFVSLINSASLSALENITGAPVDARRMRGNILLDGLGPWQEFDLVGGVLAIGDAVKLKITKRIERCAATNVDPDTGLRDLTIPRDLLRAAHHTDCGVYAEILSGGDVRVGDGARVLRGGGEAMAF
ncbi:MAG: MOSC domain-containing protein [Beijerinckiaceae bacterium]